jgi:Uma2 family endonuclease
MNVMTQPKLTLEAFLAWENEQTDKHEFYRGEVFAMTGGRRTHGRVLLNVARRFAEHLESSACQVFADSMKLQVADDATVYPDVFITCDKADLATEMVFRAPTVIVEVLSPSTQAYDRGLKFALYRRIASLQEYVLIDPETRDVEVFRRNAEGLWVLYDMTAGNHLHLASIDARIPLVEVFAGVNPPAPPGA